MSNGDACLGDKSSVDASIGLWPAWHSCRDDFMGTGRELKPHLGDVSLRLISDLLPLWDSSPCSKVLPV